MSEKHTHDQRLHTVRPRWTWIGLLVMVAGLVLIGIGIIAPSWVWAIVGLVLLAAGGGVGLYGGIFYDVHGGTSPSAHVEEVKEGSEYEFPGAGTKRSEAEVKEDIHRRWLGDGE